MMTTGNGSSAGKPGNDHVWGILLAGGDGKRLKQFIHSLYGYDRPKQFCSILGGKTMLQHTLDRALKIMPGGHILTIVNRKHLKFACEDLASQPEENLITEPDNHETGPGILLPLLHVQRRDPEAIVVLFPSDHFIYEGVRFMEYVRDAIEFVRLYDDLLVILGVQPDHAEPGYGWIEAKDLLDETRSDLPSRVKRFWEKPNLRTMRQLFRRGCLWNTMLTVGRLSTFLNLFKRFAPEVYYPFQRIRTAIGTPLENLIVREVFQTIPSVNFSRSILENSAGQLCVVRVQNVYWSDWGEQSRILTDLKRFGFLPAKRRRRPAHTISL